MTPKQQALQDLDRARTLLGSHLQRASAELNPRAVVERSLRRHPWAWAAAAGLAGLLVVRSLLPARASKFERDNLGASATKGGLIALILSPLLGMARQAALKQASHLFQTYLTQNFSRHEGERPRA